MVSRKPRKYKAAFVLFRFPKTNRADNCDFLTSYRLCVLASGSVITTILNCHTEITVSFLHFGQNSGKFSSTVSSRIFSRVLLSQAGHSNHSSFSKISPLMKRIGRILLRTNTYLMKKPILCHCKIVKISLAAATISVYKFNHLGRY